MLKRFIVFGVFFAVLVSASLAFPRKAPKETQTSDIRLQKEVAGTTGLVDLDRPLEEQGLRSSTLADTFVLGSWTFGEYAYCDPEGWTSHDLTEQSGCYWHIDDFTGLGGGTFGRLWPLEGGRSLWCGARPDTSDIILCTYAKLPGYGNGWDQGWCFKCIEVPDTERVFIDYLISWDSEPGYDFTTLEYATNSTCDSLVHPDSIASIDWNEVCSFNGTGAKQFRSDTIPSGHEGAIKIRFHFESDGAWSDQDGMWDTDGAAIIDSLTVRSEVSGVYDFEDFEDESPGDLVTTDGDWECCVLSGYGTFAALYPGGMLVQEDPCNVNLTCVWAFINGSTETYACGGFPGQIAVPKENDRGQFIEEEIRSPLIPLTGTGSSFEFLFDVYRDLPLNNLVFYSWRIRPFINGCPADWESRFYAYYGGNKDWLSSVNEVGDMIPPDASHVQVSLVVRDLCRIWCVVYGTGECHSHAPLFDNVEFRRIATTGPQWYVRDIDLFQDTFPENGTSVGTGRIDAAIDIAPHSNPNLILPGDSAVVNCADPNFFLLEPEPKSGFGSAVYFYLSVEPPNQPGKMTAAEIEEDGFRWPLVDSLVKNGRTWYQFRCDSVFTEPGGARTGPIADRFCIDVNDHVFTNGDTLWFFFSAENSNHEVRYWSQSTGTIDNIDELCEVRPWTRDPTKAMEMQILPSNHDGDILYVDNFNNRGAQPYFDTTFEIMGIWNDVDRFDKRGPSSCVGNSLGGRVKSVIQQLHPKYNKILWNSGDLDDGTVGDGTGEPEKADDFQTLFLFLDQHPTETGCGIYFSGDDMADEWATLLGSSVIPFINTYIPHSVVTGNHVIAHGVSPIVVGTPGSIFDHGPPFGVDSLIAFGGCPIINDFDQIQPMGGSTLEMTYSGTGLPTDGAVIGHDVPNALGNPAAVALSGFSFHYIRDDRARSFLDREAHLREILYFLHNMLPIDCDAGDGSPFFNRLNQNFPNPFNPSTKIHYSIKERAHVSLKIYNVAGQLVKTLVNEEKHPRVEGFTVRWNGRSNSGTPVSSGVYFCKLKTKNFTQTKKMVLLK